MSRVISSAGDLGFESSSAAIPGSLAGNAELGDSGEAVSQLNSLLRGEIAATETYRNVLSKADNSSSTTAGSGLLREMQEEHGRAAQSLRSRILELGGEASDSSGAWGVWAQTVQGTMSLFGGDTGGLKALKEGEEHGLKDYGEALDDLDPTSAQLIQNQLIPAQRKHIGVLDQLIESAGKA